MLVFSFMETIVEVFLSHLNFQVIFDLRSHAYEPYVEFKAHAFHIGMSLQTETFHGDLSAWSLQSF